MTYKTTGAILKVIIILIKPELEKISKHNAALKPDKNKWSKKEIIGHLIDSATNNHQRFVRANFKDDLIFDGYAQESWVLLQDYQNTNWQQLINLWFSYNLYLANFIDKIPTELKNKKHLKHNLDKIAWKTIPADQTATLDYFIKDYIGHLENHITQIFPNYIPQLIGKY